MQFRDIEYFVAVAEEAQVGRAALRCGVSQPTLSMQLRKLEDELGMALFERLPRRMRLTSAGEALLPKAYAVLEAAQGMKRVASQHADPLAGEVTLGLFPTLAPSLLPRILPVLTRALPRMRFRWIEEKTPALVEMLQKGTLDAALLALPVDMPNLGARPLFDEPFLLACAPDHPLAASAAPIALSALATEKVLLLEDGHCLRDQALSLCRRVGAHESQMFRATSLETLRQMVRLGTGVTLMPALAAQADRSGELHYRPIAADKRIDTRADKADEASRRIALVTRGSDRRAGLTAVLEQTIRAEMRRVSAPKPPQQP